MTARSWLARLVSIEWIALLVGLAIALPIVRRTLIRAVVTWDAVPGDPAPLPTGNGPGLAPTSRVRVALIDGLGAATAETLPAWSAVCKRGLALRVDVGFPTISLPVEVALWTGLTQQQTGIVFRSDRPLVPPLGPRGIPAQVPGSIAIAENHGWIVRSLGFQRTEPLADPADPLKDADPDGWAKRWEDRALDAVTSDARLVFVHVLAVDTAGHHAGVGAEYDKVARAADATLARLVAAVPDARWFALSDHGHIAPGGHGGEEKVVRQVDACIAGPGVETGRGELVHVVDIARALADSTGAVLDRASRGRPMSVALVAPLAPDQALPPIGLGAGALALFILAAGLGISSWGVRRWWLAPWWFVAGCGALVLVRGVPTLSMHMVYAPEGREMWLAWAAALPLAVAATWFGLGHRTVTQVVLAQLALPLAAAAAAITVCGAWPAVIGEHVAPVVPHFTAYMSAVLLLVAHGAGAITLAIIARLVRPAPPPGVH
jgi:type I phosphodiesterase/nucleotide pyrophosphatase